jgi:iron complex transport system substrate-binding protein
MRQLAPVVTLEAVIASKPQVVLGGFEPGAGGRFEAEWRSTAPPVLNELPAFYVDPDLIQRPTLRIVEGAKAVCSVLDRTRMHARTDSSKP